MSDETSELIVGDAAAAEMDQYPRRRWGWRKKKKTGPALTHCENCGTALTGRYCAQCGQPAIDYHRSFGTLLADAADAFLNLDERFLKTFVLVLFKPWRLTNDFLSGRRQRYVHPLRIYLLASVAFFFLIRALEHAHPPHRGEGIVIDGKTKRSETATPSPSPAASPATPPASPTEASKQDGINFHFDDDDDNKDRPRTPFQSWLKNRVKEKIGPTGDRGDLFLKALIDNIGPMVLCCIPLFALVLKILYIFKRRFYIEHLVFALHTHAFVFLSTLIIIGLGLFLNWELPGPLTPIVCTFLGIAVVINLLVAIRRVYRQNWFATLLKFAFGSVIYLCVLVIAFGVTAFLTLLL
jgi:uncharacterized protein DUF3667